MGTDKDPFEIHMARFWAGAVEDTQLAAIFSRDIRFPHITSKSIEAALEGFPLPFASGWGADRLAIAVRRALGCVTPDEAGLPANMQGAAKTRAELLRLASATEGLLAQIMEMTGESEHALCMLDDPDWAQYQDSITAVRALPRVIRLAAAHSPNNPTKWRTRASHELAVRQAHFLTPIFEAAYGKAATFNTWGGRQGINDAWPDFVKRMINLACQHVTKNLEVVLKEARARHIATPAEYPPFMIDLS